MGASARYLLSLYTIRIGLGGWPYATFIANVLGSFLMGLLIGAMLKGWGSDQLRLFLAVGVLGGFTTFSAFSLETVNLLESGQWEKLAVYVFGSVILSVVALMVGLLITRRLMT